MRSLTVFLQRFSLPIVEIALGFTFLWFGSLLVYGLTPLLPFFRAAALPGVSPAQLMWMIGAVEILLGLGLLLSLVSFGAATDRLILTGALLLELLYVAAIVLALFFSTAHIFAPHVPIVSTFGYFTLHKLLLLLAALLVTAHRFPEDTTNG